MDQGIFHSYGHYVRDWILDVSSFDYKLKLIYILVTYVLYEALYTCVNVPFGSLSSVMTDDVNHRTDLSRYRSLGGTIFMTVVVIAGPLVLYKDNNPIPSRFTLMALICATIGVFCLMITSSWCKERVSITVEKERNSTILKHSNISLKTERFWDSFSPALQV